MTQSTWKAMDTRWFFYRDAQGAWCWDAVPNDAVLVRSASRFATRRESVEDAKAYGYSAPEAAYQRTEEIAPAGTCHGAA